MTESDVNQIIKFGEQAFDNIISPQRRGLLEVLKRDTIEYAVQEYKRRFTPLMNAIIESRKVSNPLSKLEIAQMRRDLEMKALAYGEKQAQDFSDFDQSQQIPAEDVLAYYAQTHRGVFGVAPNSPNHYTLTARRAERVAHFRGKFAELADEDHLGVFKRVGATVTCNGATYAMAVEKNAENQTQYLIFDSHGGRGDINRGRTGGYVYITTNIDDAARYLERVVQYEAPSTREQLRPLAISEVGPKPYGMESKAYEAHIQAYIDLLIEPHPLQNRVGYAYQVSAKFAGE